MQAENQYWWKKWSTKKGEAGLRGTGKCHIDTKSYLKTIVLFILLAFHVFTNHLNTAAALLNFRSVKMNGRDLLPVNVQASMTRYLSSCDCYYVSPSCKQKGGSRHNSRIRFSYTPPGCKRSTVQKGNRCPE